jgi:hypothetical protein
MKSIVLVAALAAVVMASAAQAQSADTILVNGKVITLDPRSLVTQAIAIRDGKVLATGSDVDIRNRADAHTKVVVAVAGGGVANVFGERCLVHLR